MQQFVGAQQPAEVQQFDGAQQTVGTQQAAGAQHVVWWPVAGDEVCMVLLLFIGVHYG